MNTPGYTQPQYGQPTTRYVQTMDLRDDPALVAEYRRRHTQGEVWPEVLQGIRAVGILQMEIYILGTHLVMIVDAPADFDWTAAMERLATLPRQQEWEATMALFQQCAAQATSNQKWQPMERMFHLYN